MQVVQTSVVVQVSTVFVPATEAVPGPAVGLPWRPAPGNNTGHKVITSWTAS